MVTKRSNGTYFHTQVDITFKFELQDTQFVTGQRRFREKLHKRSIEALLGDPEQLATALGNVVGSKAYKSAKDKLKQIMKHPVGKVDTEYIHVVNDYHVRLDELGRLYPKLQGYTTLNKALRGPLGGKERYWYLDMKNAHSSIVIGLGACGTRSDDFSLPLNDIL